MPVSIYIPFWLFAKLLKLADTGNARLDTTGRALPKSSVENCWLLQLINYASRGFACFFHGFLLFSNFTLDVSARKPILPYSMAINITYFGVSGKRRGVTHNNVFLLSTGSEDITTESNENCRFQPPHCRARPSLQGTPRIPTYYCQKLEYLGYILGAIRVGLSSFKFSCGPKLASVGYPQV